MPMEVAILNVKCAVGAGHIVGIHVGDDMLRREYLILGEPISQIAEAENAACHGEVLASPEAVAHLLNLNEPTVDDNDEEESWDEAIKNGRPIRIARRNTCYFEPKEMTRQTSSSCEVEDMLPLCDELDSTELQWLKRMLSLYVHPVVVNDNSEQLVPLKKQTDQDRHIAQAELRNGENYTCKTRGDLVPPPLKTHLLFSLF